MEETKNADEAWPRRSRDDSVSSASTTSLVFERLHEENEKGSLSSAPPYSKRDNKNHRRTRTTDSRGVYTDNPADEYADEDALKESEMTDPETGPFLPGAGALPLSSPRRTGMDRSLKRILWIVCGAFLTAWAVALVIFVTRHARHDPEAAGNESGAKPVTLDQVMSGFWRPKLHSVTWVEGPDGQDGFMLEQGAADQDYLVVVDVRASKLATRRDEDGVPGEKHPDAAESRTLMKSSKIKGVDGEHEANNVWPSRDLKKVLVATQKEHNWRHSFTAVYYLLDVETQKAEPLDPDDPRGKVQLATWSPQSDAVVFTRDNNMYLRKLTDDKVTQMTDNGGPEYFYGVPDWVYEEEVFADRSATWWSADGKHIAFLRTNETGVPEYPVQYFLSRPSGKEPEPGEENYPEVRQIKYPKAGSHNPVVDLMFYDVEKAETFSVDVEGDFPDDDRIVNHVMWANDKVLVKSTNRISDVMKVVLVNVAGRSGKAVRHVDVSEVDGGWFEISHDTRFIPADPEKGRPDDGYVDPVIHDNGDHLAYFHPMDSEEPEMITQGRAWEVAKGPMAVDLDNNLVYYSSTEESPIERHVYSVHLNGSDARPVCDKDAGLYCDVSFSSSAGFALVSYLGPAVPRQLLVSTLSNPAGSSAYERVVEENQDLARKVKKHEIPTLEYGTIETEDGGLQLNYVERRPRHFDASKKHPVLFQQYSGPGSQSVTRKFAIDFQSYVASALGYLVVTVDGRGTGYMGREARVAVRGHLGRYEARDQIAAARHWAAKPYVDPERLAIWGWSFGGFNTLKTLEVDAGETFSYGMAVAPVTDWRFYDSIYTERYMSTPQLNPDGYDETAVSNASALGQNARFLVMHGVADDNVHMQSTLALLDKLDLAGVENYDVHVFPDSDHGIYFHNANRIVYDKLSNWLINAFNGEWLKVADAKPKVDPGPEKAKRMNVEDMV